MEVSISLPFPQQNEFWWPLRWVFVPILLYHWHWGQLSKHHQCCIHIVLEQCSSNNVHVQKFWEIKSGNGAEGCPDCQAVVIVFFIFKSEAVITHAEGHCVNIILSGNMQLTFARRINYFFNDLRRAICWYIRKNWFVVQTCYSTLSEKSLSLSLSTIFGIFLMWHPFEPSAWAKGLVHTSSQCDVARTLLIPDVMGCVGWPALCTHG